MVALALIGSIIGGAGAVSAASTPAPRAEIATPAHVTGAFHIHYYGSSTGTVACLWSPTQFMFCY